MKNLTNILSYLWLLLLMAVTACSDLEEEVDPMKGEEEVELTIRTQVPGMKVGTRAAETENLTTITALVFNAEEELIKKVDNIVASTTSNTQGTFTLKVPLRTRSIHFIGNPTGVNLPSVPSEGDAAVTHDALKTLTTTGSLAYWGYASFADVAALRAYKNQTLILYRNKAKISIEKAGTFKGSLAIAGLENVYKKGVLVPHNGDGFNFNLTNYDYQTLPTSVSNEEKGQEKYEPTVTETYVFEHPNDEGNALFAICLINNKYYKVALAKNNSGTLSYYDIIRNHQYRIKINAINESLGQDSYENAVKSDPINNAEAEVEETKDAVLTIESISANELVYNAGNKQLSMTVNIPEGVSALTINAPNFTASTTNGNLSSTGNNTFNVNSAGRVTFTLTLNNGVGSRGQQETISVVGTAKEGYKVTNPESKTIILKEQVSLQTSLLEGVSSLMYSNKENSESDLIVNVTIPAGVTTLEFSSDYFDVISANGRTKKETVDGVEVSTPYITGSGPYTVNHQGVGELTLPFRLRLKDDKKASTSSAGFTFDGSGEGVKVVPATMSNITLTENDDEYVRWQGDVLLDWGNEGAVTQIPLPYSWFEGISAGSTLQVEYVITDLNNPEIQFAEVDGEWNNPNEDSYFFPELEVTMNDGGKMGLNLNKNSQPKNIGSQTGIVYTYDLTITQAVLDNIIKMNDRNITLLGESNVVMAIQGGSVRLKKISVMPAAENPNNPLSIELDFYQTEGENLGDGATYSNLALNSSHFYLKATVTGDLSAYHGQPVQLQGTFSSPYQYGNSNEAIHWTNSRQTNSSSISYYGERIDGKGLQFTIDRTKDVYIIDWVFQTGSLYTGYGDIQFTYTLSNNKGHSITGDRSATIAFTNEPVGTELWSGSKSLSWPANGAQAEYITINQNLPAGTQVMLHFTTSGGQLEVHDSNTQSFRPNGIASDRYSAGNDDCFNVNNGETLIKFTLQNAMDGLKINGNAVTMTKIVAVYPNGAPTPTETVVFEYDFSASTSDITYNGVNDSKVKIEGGELILYNPSPAATNDYDVQIYVDKAYEAGSYTLTYRVKGDVNELVDGKDYNYTQLAFQVKNGYVNASDFRNISFTADWQPVSLKITVNQNCDRFLINFGKHVGYIYIDDLKLVKNN